MLVKRLFLLGGIIAILLAGCNSQTPVPTPDLFSDNPNGNSISLPSDFETKLEWGECPFNSFEVKAECGTVTVPADYNQPNNGETLTLHFGRYKTQNPDPKPDPVVLVAGFPLLSQAGFLPFLFEDVFKERDLLVFDVRGMGLSGPALVCPEVQAAWWGSLPLGGLTPEQWGDAHTLCRQSWETQKVNLDAYSLSAMAADFKALRLALGYPAWNIVAVGNGAYQAYEQLRTDPEGVRSIMIDSVVPIFSEKPVQLNAANETLHTIFEQCVQDEDCNTTFPNIEQAFYDMVAQLDQQPLTIRVNNNYTGQQTDMLVNGIKLVEITLELARSSDLERIGQLPRMVYQLREGKTTTLVKLAGLYMEGTDYTLQGIYSLASCRHMPLPDETLVESALTTLPPGLSGYFSDNAAAQRATCAVWGPLPSAAPPSISSGVPIMLLNGEWDWGNPPEMVEQFKRIAPGTQVVTYPGAGGNLFFTRGTMQCSDTLFKTFMNDPETPLDTQCAQAERKITWITLP